ncbi:hypothetical protein F4810DRAFT_684387 [Camillea tinctor]|nr:hypothetical protein F4810DRAFT_684387 [Camillea tinctor]
MGGEISREAILRKSCLVCFVCLCLHIHVSTCKHNNTTAYYTIYITYMGCSVDGLGTYWIRRDVGRNTRR